MTDYILSSGPLNEIQNHENYIIVWYDSHICVPKELKSLTDYLYDFDSFEDCEKYLKTFQSERKILLILTSVVNEFLYFINLPQIYSIYILDKNDQNIKYKKIEDYSKLVYVCNDECILIERLYRDILLTYRNDLPVTISYLKDTTNELSSTSFNKNILLFYWNQLFTYYIVHSPNTDMDKLKEDMVEQCRLEYQNNPIQLNYIDDFYKTCTSDTILKWYTNSSCIFKLVNKAFRTQNIDLICKFRYFTILLYNKLRALAIEQQSEKFTIVYRAQNMKKNELEMLKNNTGSLISINTIMSTTRNRNVAQFFLDHTAEVSVILEMNIGNVKNNIIYPYADISHSSSFPEEEEILFFTGAVFRIDTVERENNSTWIIRLTLANEMVENLEQVMNILETQLSFATYYGNVSEKTNDYSLFNWYHKHLTNSELSLNDIVPFLINIDLSYLLNHSGDSKRMIEYYQELLDNDNFTYQPKFIILNILIGNNYFRLQLYDDASIHYTLARSLIIDKQNRLMGEIKNYLGDIERESNDMQCALLYYKEALKIIMNYPDKDKSIPGICRKIVDIYVKQNNSEDAIVYQTQANESEQFYEEKSRFLDIDSVLKYHRDQFNVELDRDIVDYVNKLYTTGMHFIRKSDYLQGLENLLQAEEFFKNYFSSYDYIAHRLAKLYEHVAFAYLVLKDRLNALTMWKKAIHLRTSFNHH